MVILGGGTAGCVLAARLSEDAGRSVCLVEGGPDYGHHDSGGWPAEMLDGRNGPDSHDWSDRHGSLNVARVIGGCSAHNLCFWVRPPAEDWDDWARASDDPAWSAEGIAPAIQRVEERMPLELASGDAVNPWLRTLMEAADEIGLGSGDEIGSLVQGVAPIPLNVRGTDRWNAAFAYLDEARDRPNLTILDDALVDRIEIEGGRAAGAIVHRSDGVESLGGDRIVLSAGAYGSPAILLRSGIGPAAELQRHGIEQHAELPVGVRLRDHFGVRFRLAPSREMQQRLDQHAAGGLTFVSQGLMKARSSRCPDELWDMHGVILAIPAVEGGYPEREGHLLGLSASLLRPAWSGSVRLRSTSPSDLPEVAPHDLGDEADMEAVLEGLALCRRLVEADAARGAWSEQLAPDPELDEDGLRRHCADSVGPYFHPVGSCAMGRAGDGASTVDATGRVHGIDGLHVADASIIPSTPRANTNMPTLVVAERIAERLGALASKPA